MEQAKHIFLLKLGKILGIPVYHLNVYYYNPNWQGIPIDEFTKINTELINNKQWILDGNYKITMQLRMKACDTIVFIDRPRFICYFNIFKRLIKYYGKHRADMAPGCKESFDWDFI